MVPRMAEQVYISRFYLKQVAFDRGLDYFPTMTAGAQIYGFLFQQIGSYRCLLLLPPSIIGSYRWIFYDYLGRKYQWLIPYHQHHHHPPQSRLQPSSSYSSSTTP